ncbi:hypothetical protein [Streptomyces mirabilis]|uniref:hypothetical protein n=1 Tax=Streptomyces mirabilis TaxID=68239 RepID=UPI003F4BA928
MSALPGVGGERPALDVLHDGVQDVAVLAVVVDDGDMGPVLDARHRLSLLAESLDAPVQFLGVLALSGVAVQCGHLHRDRPVQAEVESEPDGALGAAAEG